MKRERRGGPDRGGISKRNKERQRKENNPTRSFFIDISKKE
jgi:hypothetical protein